jgi:hypothetical protein
MAPSPSRSAAPSGASQRKRCRSTGWRQASEAIWPRSRPRRRGGALALMGLHREISARPSPSGPRGGARCPRRPPAAGCPGWRAGCGHRERDTASVVCSTSSPSAPWGSAWWGPRRWLKRRSAPRGIAAAASQRHSPSQPAPRAAPPSTEARQGTRRHRRSQICFSGICTTSPSSASETLSWQVRRERSVSGS